MGSDETILISQNPYIVCRDGKIKHKQNYSVVAEQRVKC